MTEDDSFELFDNTQAHKEGWGIFECGESSAGPWQLQQVDEMATFNDDEEAWAFVVNRAKGGSAYHLAALRFCEKHNPMEIESFASMIASGTCRTCKHWSEAIAKGGKALCLSPYRNHDQEFTSPKTTCIAYEWGLPVDLDQLPEGRVRDEARAARMAALAGIPQP